MSQARTLGELRVSQPAERVSVREEMRRNLLRKLRAREPVFPGVVGYDDSVIPQITNAVLSKHNMILLGLRGQAKSRILRSLTSLLDPAVPVVAGCEINDHPLAPICRRCRDLIAAKGDDTPVAWLAPEARYVEKLATPDVTIADIIGDIDPIRAARGGLDLASELTMHYGLLPRAHRGIFALNELPDLAGRIQVGLFNILQEGDVQIKGYPVRLPIDVSMVFTANPEDYTARGKIITPLKDRIGSEVRTHYPTTIEHGVAITVAGGLDRARARAADPALGARGGGGGGLRGAARQEDRPQERRLAAAADQRARERGEQRRAAGARLGRDAGGAARLRHLRLAAVAHRQVRARVRGRAGRGRERGARADPRGGGRGVLDLPGLGRPEAGGAVLRGGRHAADPRGLHVGGGAGAAAARAAGAREPGGARGRARAGPRRCRRPPGEFVLEGLWAQKKIGRSDDRGFVATERRADLEIDMEHLERLRRLKKQVN